MRTILTKTLAASFALALALTLSCSDDKDEGGSDPSNGGGGGGSASFCELKDPADTRVPSCLELPSNECSASLYSSTSYSNFTFTKVDKCTKETPDIACYNGKSDDGTNSCGLSSKSFCETIGSKGVPFKTLKECLNYTPPAPTGPLCKYGDWCGNVKAESNCAQVGGTIVSSCD